LAHLYSHDLSVVDQAATLLWCVALYHLVDGLQALGVFMLRCWRITVAPLVIYAILLWGLGLYGGYVLCYEGFGPWEPWHSASAFWLAGAAALLLTALAFWVLLAWAMRRTPQSAH
jgi:MATE family multidrug resistance protein